MLRLLDKIPAHLPKAWVTGILLWFAGLISMGLAALCLLVKFRFGYGVFFGLVGCCVLAFLGCVLWLVVEKVAGRVTPWRSDA